MFSKGSSRGYLVGLSREAKQGLIVTLDTTSFLLCAMLAGWAVYGQTEQIFASLIPGAIAASLTLLIGWMQGMYRTVTRFAGRSYVITAAISSASAAWVVAILSAVLFITPAPFRWTIVYWVFSLSYLLASRWFIRLLLVPKVPSVRQDRTVIYGAGSAGAKLINCIDAAGEPMPFAVVDDDPSLHGQLLNGIRICSPDELPRMVEEDYVKRVLLAIPSASRTQRMKILDRLSPLPARVMTIPDIRDLVTGQAQVDDLREVSVADLLGRQTVPPNEKLLHAAVTGKSVLVTGAGGSIGSELCRQIVMLGVRRLILFESNELALYKIDQEIRRLLEVSGADCEVIPLLGSVCDYSRVYETIKSFKAETVYHAAAYKHVPLVEQNIIQGVRNNVIGTYTVAKASCELSVEMCVLISTDKAVRPTSVMGATKRFSELILQGIQEKCEHTRFSMVRFGNVLESSGSVVPLFREQIYRGGPVTVTHPEVVRYFMTIPEAAELVIQAGSMATGGDVFVLDMGAPIRIDDLAKRMIRLSGMTVKDDDNPNGDIDITYIGLRPGEKLYEELLVGEDVSGTEHPRIMRAVDDYIPYARLISYIETLDKKLVDHDCDGVRELLCEIVDTYNPANDLEDLVWSESANEAERQAKSGSNVTRIA